MAYGVPALRADELKVLQAGEFNADGNACLMAAGTGLGQAILVRQHGRLVPSPSEGGHSDFGPRGPREIALLEFLTARYGRATYEHIISGKGFINLLRFTSDNRSPLLTEVDEDDLPATISRHGLDGSDPHCVEALQLFVSIYGSAAANLGPAMRRHRRRLPRWRHSLQAPAGLRPPLLHGRLPRQATDDAPGRAHARLDRPQSPDRPPRRRRLRRVAPQARPPDRRPEVDGYRLQRAVVRLHTSRLQAFGDHSEGSSDRQIDCRRQAFRSTLRASAFPYPRSTVPYAKWRNGDGRAVHLLAIPRVAWDQLAGPPVASASCSSVASRRFHVQASVSAGTARR